VGVLQAGPRALEPLRDHNFQRQGGRDADGVIEGLASDAADLLAHLGVGRAHVLGTSLGGFVAQELALRRPELVGRVVLVSTGHGGRGAERMSPGSMGEMFGLGALSPKRAARRGLEGAHLGALPGREPSGVRADRGEAPLRLPVFGLLLRPGHGRLELRRLGRGAAHSRPHARGPRRRGPPRAASNARALAEAIPDARLRVIEGAGHLVFVERAAEVNREVLAFLGEGEPSVASEPA
jgi:3-oxoadipate enol-lactonase